MTVIDQVSTEQCCLCKACADICPVDAIQFKREINSFQYPYIDYDNCLSCNKCESVCPFLGEPFKLSAGYPMAFAARNRDKVIRMNSTSGGVFFEIANYIFRNGGYVCGAIIDDQFIVRHILANSISDLEKMRGSKYAQSNLEGIYARIEQLARQDKTILFCGCPCQTAALKKYLGRAYEKVYLIDFICHGIPSQKMLDDYRMQLEKQYCSKAKTFLFRSKEKGWHRSSVHVEFENNKKYSKPITDDAYMRAFLSGVSLKEACYACSYKNFQSGSDLTLGDFWGAEIMIPETDDNTGLSAMFVNTWKGAHLVETLELELIPVECDMVVQYNTNIIESSKPSEMRQKFLEYAVINSYGEAFIHFFKETRYEEIQRKSHYLFRCIFNKLRGKEMPLY